MFTGLIEEVGTIAQIQPQDGGGKRLTVHAQTILSDLGLGDSVAVDGTCTTVVARNDQGFEIEVSPETLSKTLFRYYREGDRVNLERPLLPTTRLGGHYVTGHVDGLGHLLERYEEGNSWIFRFALANAEFACLLVPKGSIAVNGISLTVNTVENDQFTVAIIPHTLAHTNLDTVTVGQPVNIETDLLGKYVQRILAVSQPDSTPAAPAWSGPPEPITVPDLPRIHSGAWFNHE